MWTRRAPATAHVDGHGAAAASSQGEAASAIRAGFTFAASGSNDHQRPVNVNPFPLLFAFFILQIFSWFRFLLAVLVLFCLFTNIIVQ
jgi:hypothetical protein